MQPEKKIGITEVVLRDGIQSLLATRVPLRDLVSILPILDKVGYWSLETWGGATYDACIRYLNEDPWAYPVLEDQKRTESDTTFCGGAELGVVAEQP